LASGEKGVATPDPARRGDMRTVPQRPLLAGGLHRVPGWSTPLFIHRFRLISALRFI